MWTAGSPMLSTVKISIIRVQPTTGILLGYSFNSRWAIETGLYVDRKKYYTDGDILKKPKRSVTST